jgi:hypothetical protein
VSRVIASILDSLKKPLNIMQDDTSFDDDLILHINSYFSTLTQLGVGPSSGFMISDSTTTWDAYLDSDLLLNSVKSYMYAKLRLIFDPPQNSFAVTSLEKIATEFEWRLNVVREGETWVDPTLPVV